MKTARSLLYFNLVKLLEKNKISNNELAQKIDMATATLSHKMMGNTDWKLSEMLKVQQQINSIDTGSYTLDYLFKKE